jgi:large subunit ribosomal protein L15
MLTLKNLKSPKGANKNTKRLGRGQASGQGTQAGKGHKGQKARKSGHVRLGFEGNNLPLYMRLPKMNVFSNAPFKTVYAEVDLGVLENKFNTTEEITRESLIERGLLKGINKRLPIKVLAKEKKLEKKLNFTGIEKFSRGAEELVKNAGGAIK